MNFKKSILKVLLLVILLVCCGCGAKKSSGDENMVTEYFQEQEISLPDDLLATFDMYEAVEGTQYLIGKTEKTNVFYGPQQIQVRLGKKKFNYQRN